MAADGCYCGESSEEGDLIQCQQCKNDYHTNCLKSGIPSSLEGDTFFNLICTRCSPDAEEEVSRLKMQWLQVVMLTLYNLQRTGSGKKGYFRWKEHICAFIDKHWILLFGQSKKKTYTWHGTVAGALSCGCPQYFVSGSNELKESGWWRLSDLKPPTMHTVTSGKAGKKSSLPNSGGLRIGGKEPSPLKMESLRSRAGKTSIQAAMELKAKRDTLQHGNKDRGQNRNSIERMASSTSTTSDPSTSQELIVSPVHSPPIEVWSAGQSASESAAEDSFTMHSVQSSSTNMSVATELMDQGSQMSYCSSKSDQWFTERDLLAGEKVPDCLLMDDHGDSDLEIDPCALSPEHFGGMIDSSNSLDTLPQMEDIMASMDSKRSAKGILSSRKNLLGIVVSDSTSASFGFRPQFHLPDSVNSTPVVRDTSSEVPSETADEESTDITDEEQEPDEDEDESEQSDSSESTDEPNRTRKRKHVESDQDVHSDREESSHTNLVGLSLYEEKALLQKLQRVEDVITNDPEINRLRRKLLVRQVKRERGIHLFDLDLYMKKMNPEVIAPYPSDTDRVLQYQNTGLAHPLGRQLCVLDRFQSNHLSYYQRGHVSFLNRLVGTEDDQLQPVTSPYTARLLKPFIRRDYESRPVKLKLLQEIISYPHRNEPKWEPNQPPPIDYSYVRPQHIPSVNALCREFFWPGIDLSECLQYPDFSCVVQYRRFVIGFAFMVPDVKYNEAYISFIFTHPDWRQAGIAKFMLYHLIQTCMGKDVTLHVSASNSAMMLYQKFGFKPEEFILDFYDKYLPVDSTECKHAFFLRLHR